MLFGFIPGFPFIPFMILGAGSGALAFSIIRNRSKAEEMGGDPTADADPEPKNPENLLGTLSLDR